MFNTHPDTIRPDHSAGGYFPSGPFPAESPGIVQSMATVILRQASDGQPTLIDDFRNAPETRHLSPDELRANIGKAKAIADEHVLRQDDPGYRPFTEAGAVHGMREASRDDELAEATEEQLLEIATGACASLVTDDLIVGTLLQQGFRPAAISRIWPRLTVKLAAGVAQIQKPSIGAIARAARVA
jgi:hypothetical protein